MSSLHSLENGTVSVTNTQKHASWVPVAVLFRFDAPVTATLTVTSTATNGTVEIIRKAGE
jgi:hypothetical protein